MRMVLDLLAPQTSRSLAVVNLNASAIQSTAPKRKPSGRRWRNAANSLATVAGVENRTLPKLGNAQSVSPTKQNIAADSKTKTKN